jgi:GH15 family glucan-1,4-alpha-glucosidase
LLTGGGDEIELGDRGLLSDTGSAALVAADGTIDWWCPSHLDAPAAFYRLLDPRGGALRVSPAEPGELGSQSYDDGTLTCATELTGRDCRLLVTDAMPWDGHRPSGRIVRLVTARRGPAEVVIDVVPGRAFAPAREVSAWSTGMSFDGTTVRTGVPMRVGLASVADGREQVVMGRGRVRLDTGERLVVTVDPPSDQSRKPEPLSNDRASAVLERTAGAWRRVLAGALVEGPWADLAARSLTVLRSLGWAAAPTTSLPEVQGGERTADARMIRVELVSEWASEAAAARLSDETAEAAAWLLGMLDEIPPPAVVGLDRSPPASERILPLSGWRRSQPVRVGYDPPERPSPETAAAVLSSAVELADTVAAAPLLGGWDRLAVLAEWLGSHRTGEANLARWLSARHALAGMAALAWRRNPLDLDAAAWHRQRMTAENALVADTVARQGALGDGTDAAVLRAAWLGPWPGSDPVVSATIARTRSRLGAGPWLLACPPEADDGRPGPRAASVVATLWLARALAVNGQWEDANLTMEAVAGLAGPLGLLPEHVDPTTGLARGNRPSAAAHLALLQAARALTSGPA